VEAVHASNEAITCCPVINGIRAEGIIDTLLFLSDAYSALQRYCLILFIYLPALTYCYVMYLSHRSNESLQSAKLAVSIAHDQMSGLENVSVRKVLSIVFLIYFCKIVLTVS
jgi:hypothetical protein